MKLTNKYGLPVEYAAKKDSYSSGGSDITASSIARPVRLRALEKRHDAELTQDVSDRLYTTDGQVRHLILERAGQDDALVEVRLFADVLGWKLSGQFDHLTFREDRGILSDHKNVKSYALKHIKNEWIIQLNVLRWLIHENLGWDMKELRIKATVRDYSKTQSARCGALNMMDSLCGKFWKEGREPSEEESLPFHQKVLDACGYPPLGYFGISLPVWSLQETKEYIEKRIRENQAALSLKDDDLPHCSEEERWKRPDVFAVMKDGGKRAVSGGVLYSRDEADAKVSSLGAGYHIEERPGESVRCTHFCSVKSFCNQGRSAQETNDPE